jgi:hypothetical protein
MPIRVREIWSQRRLSLREPWQAMRVFNVDGAASDAAACLAQDAVSGFRIPQYKDAHDSTTSLLCGGPAVVGRDGPTSYQVQCAYELDPRATGGAGGNPLSKPVEITWETVEISEPVDSDLDHLPILNSAGEPLRGGSRNITFKRLKLVKNMPYYDINLSVSYENSVNSAAMTFLGQVSIDVQHMRCAVIGPTTTYTTVSPFVPIMFLFDVFLDDSLGKYPFQHRFLDASTVGWYTDSGTKKVAKWSDGKGNVFGSDVRLDGTGIPLPGPYSNIKVGEDNASPVTPPKAISYYQKEIYSDAGQLTPLVSPATQAVFLYWKKARIKDLSPLTSLI